MTVFWKPCKCGHQAGTHESNWEPNAYDGVCHGQLAPNALGAIPPHIYADGTSDGRWGCPCNAFRKDTRPSKTRAQRRAAMAAEGR